MFLILVALLLAGDFGIDCLAFTHKKGNVKTKWYGMLMGPYVQSTNDTGVFTPVLVHSGVLGIYSFSSFVWKRTEANN